MIRSGNIMVSFRVTAILIMLCALMSHPVAAQSTAILSGATADSSGAIVSGAKVLCRNSRTGLPYNAVTNDEGIFRFPDLPVGVYDLTISHPGFATSHQQNIVLSTGQSVYIPIQLVLGQVSQSITVSGTSQEIQPTSSELQTTLGGKSMGNLPLNGRNPLQLVLLAPGAIASGGVNWQSANQGVAVNGNRGTDNGYLLDGVSYIDPHYGTAPVLPSPDALQEFTVKTSNFSAAETGSGANVEFTTKSGANRISGSLFEYVRNSDFDAKNYFSSAPTPFKRNQFGGSLGGPLMKNKAFYFGSFQDTRTVGGANPSVANVPSADFLAGNFSALSTKIIDPATGLPFLNNTIPSTRFDQDMVKILSYYPAANQANGTYNSLPRSNSDDTQVMGRVDYQLTGKDHLMARYFYDDYTFQEQTTALPSPYGFDKFLNRNALISDTHIFSPSLLLLAGFGFTNVGRQRQAAGLPFLSQDLPGVNVPVATVDSVAAQQLDVGLSGYAGFISGTPITVTPLTFEYRVHLTWERGKHMIQFGVDAIRYDEYAWDRSNQQGTWTFNGSRTSSTAYPGSGNSIADALLGLPVTFTQHGTEPQNMYQTQVQPWIQDDWSVRPDLTLNLGLRYAPWLPAVDRLAPQVGFEPGVQSVAASGAPTGLLFSGDHGLPHAIFNRNMDNFAPRIGFAWNINGDARSVVRGAYGIFFRPMPLNMQRFSGNTAAFRSLATSVSDPESFENPYGTAGGSPFPWTPVTPAGLESYVFKLPVTTSALVPHAGTSYVQEWNLTLERQVTRNIGASVAYIGNHMIKGMDSTEANPAIYIPGQSTEANVNSRRPYTGLASIQSVRDFQFSNYNGLQISFNAHAEKGLTLISNYTWSKCMDNDSQTTGGVSIINKFNVNADYARCDFNVAQTGNISIVYDLPNMPWFHGYANKALNGWQASMITVLRTGGYFSVSSGIDNSLTGPTTNSGTNDLADRVTGISTARPSGVKKIAEYFNTAAYQENALGTFGNSGRNSMVGPGYWESDASLLKSFPIKDAVNFELKAEFFNLPNKVNFSSPGATFTSTSSFGKIQSAGAPRVIQLSGRLTF
ncbi:MAG TPA: TonB-dependent receptor [Terracidiphilus sp.]|nr:TonB-dependent receptor [Terracidiphilus sp.]